MHFISHNSFAANRTLHESLLWEDRIHANKRGLQELAFDFYQRCLISQVFKSIIFSNIFRHML